MLERKNLHPMESDIGLPIPSSPSSSSLYFAPKPSPRSPPTLRTHLSRSNSTPKASRVARAFSQDLSSIQTNPALDRALLQEERTKLTRWVEAFVIVNFDLDIGPVMEHSVPERRWGIGVTENIAFSSFPDTSLFTEGQLSWSFKLNDGLVPDRGALREEELNKERLNGGEGGGQQEGRLFGFVLFLQKRDGSIKRGFFQVSGCAGCMLWGQG